MNELSVSTKVRLELASHGAVCWKVSDRFHASRPDLIACYQGKFIAIEMKIYPNKPTLAQTFELNQLAFARAWAYSVQYDKKTKQYIARSYPTGETATFESVKDLCVWLLRCSDINRNL